MKVAPNYKYYFNIHWEQIMQNNKRTAWNKGKTNIYSEETLERIRLGRSKQNMGMWITNGLINKKFYGDKSSIPLGWWNGRRMVVNETKKNIVTKEKYIEKYGEENGKIMWELLNERKKCTLENLIKKYGEEEGEKRYKETCKKKSIGQTLEYYIKKYGEEEGTKKLEDLNKRKNSWDGFRKVYGGGSKQAKAIFDEISNFINENFSADFIKYDLLNTKNISEYYIYDEKTKKRYFYDFVFSIRHKICAIEFNGVHVHAKTPDDANWKHAFNGQSAKTCFQYDEYKKQVFLEKHKNSFYFVIWSDDIELQEIKEKIYENFKN